VADVIKVPWLDVSRPTGGSPAHARSVAGPDDSGAGLAMFLIFTAAVLIVTGAVAVVALVGTWWMLAVGFAMHVAMTIVVVLTIVEVMAGRDHVLVRRRRSGRPLG
jgi:hypothetical protein